MKRSPATLAALVLAAVLGFFLLAEKRPGGVVPPGDEIESQNRTARRGDGGFGFVTQNDEKIRQVKDAVPLSRDFLDRAVEGESFRLKLPGDRDLRGTVTLQRRDGEGILFVQGVLEAPAKGRFFFQRQTTPGVAGALAGHILFEGQEGQEEAWKVEPSGPGGAPQLVRVDRGEVLCVNFKMPAPEAVAAALALEKAPEAHPIDIPIPDYQTIIPLQSLPGAVGVIYLDFDGEQGPFAGWGEYDAAAPGVTNAQVYEVWKMVSEDFQGFNLNITTDRKVFDNAASGRRQHVIISPTTTASPGAGGVAFSGSYNWSTSTVCWAFYSVGKFCAEVISHEVGHTLGLSHDGRLVPVEEYYYGHGSGETGWAPIMGAGYYEKLTQWSKGEYKGANRTQDDLALITSNNNVDYRVDDIGDELPSARYLEIAADDTVSNEGIIERSSDVDSFRFVTSGGPVEIHVDPVTDNPNLDVLAELVNVATGDYLFSSNPENGIGAVISAELPAGEYIIEVSGVGKGDPLEEGYTDYGSMGAYFVTGSVSGGVKPDRFTVEETTADNAVVGTVAPRLDHGAATLQWSIESGNTGNAFEIDEDSGEIRVVNPGALNFETLSTRWDDPASFELMVRIRDQDHPELDEILRVVVTVSDVNEAPVMNGGAVTILERTRPGTALFTMVSSDPDRFDFARFAILSGNEDGKVAIDEGSGVISVSESGLGEVDFPLGITLTVQVTDHGNASDTAVVQFTVIDIVPGYVPGGITRTYYEGILGGTVASLTNAVAQFPDHPDSEETLPAFDGHAHGDNFGSSLRGFFIPPVTGSYRFWIASDGSSQLWFDSTPEQSELSQIAAVNGGTDHYQWADNSPNRSGSIALTAGKAYYIEALHKESTGADHVSVAFSGPGMPKQLLGGRYLAPYTTNYAPRLSAEILSIQEDAFPGQTVGTVHASDVNEEDSHNGFSIIAGNEGNLFTIDPVTGVVSLSPGAVLDAMAAPTHTMTVAITDTGTPPLTGSGEVKIHVLPTGYLADKGIIQQIWTEMAAGTLQDIASDPRYPYAPSLTRVLESFDTGEEWADEYASRIRALVTPAASGYYTFYLSSNEEGVLLLGSDATAASAQPIASVAGWCQHDEWNKYPTQQAEPVYLEAGQDYYIETLQRDSSAADHVQVGWTGPDIPSITVIPGSALRPYDLNEAPAFAAAELGFTVTEGAAVGSLIGEVRAQDPELESAIHVIASGNEPGAFAIDAASGVLSVANAAALGVGQHALIVSAQDRGLGGEYPLKTSSIAVTVTVLSNNQAPAFPVESDAVGTNEDQAFAMQLSASDPDVGDLLVFTKISGPTWLTVAADGALGGVPRNADVGSRVLVVRVTDPEGLYDEMELSIAVANVNDAPVFSGIPLELSLATQDEAYTVSLEGLAYDVDAGDRIRYSKVEGPEWIAVAEDGVLTGTPRNADVGAAALTVRVTDAAGAFNDKLIALVVGNVNDAPVFSAPVISATAATEDEAYAASLAAEASDPDVGDALSFAMISGPSWVSVGSDGTLTGTPGNGDVGVNLLVVSVTDAAGISAEATVSVEVANTNDVPVFLNDPILGNGGKEELAYDGVSLATQAADEDAGDTLVFSKTDGPLWLTVAEDGTLSGTPPLGTSGLQVFTVRATDSTELSVEAALLIEIVAKGPPLPWDDGGIGNIPAEGSTMHGNGSFIVTGAGEFAGRNDSFQFVWQPLSGGGSITARVESQVDSSSLSRAGVMIRDTLGANSRHVFLGVTGDGKYRWVRRTGFNGNTSSNGSGSAVLPDAWMRLTRAGNLITAFKSTDGVSWTEIGSLSADFPETSYFGLAVASGSPSLLNEARFSNVIIDP